MRLLPCCHTGTDGIISKCGSFTWLLRLQVNTPQFDLPGTSLPMDHVPLLRCACRGSSRTTTAASVNKSGLIPKLLTQFLHDSECFRIGRAKVENL